MLSEMEKRQPEEYQTLTGIEGFQDLRESCDSMMPAKNTVGAVALAERAFIHSDEPKETIDTMGVKTLAGFLAMNELTEGVEDWRSVPVNEEEYSTKREDYYELLSIYGTTYSLTDDKEFMKSLSAPGKVTSVAQKGYQLFYDSFQNARKEYPEKYRSDVKSDDKTFKKMAFSHFMTLRALEGEVKPDGSIKAVKDSMLKYEAAFDEIGMDFMASMPPEELDALLAGDSSDKAVENAVRKFVANLDKIPEGLPKGVQPSAKERIQALQQKPEAKKKKAPESGDAFNKAAQPAREAARKAEKPVSYLDYINKLNLENPTSQDVAKLVAATSLLITQEEGAQAIANPKEIDKIAAAIDNEPAFQNMMKDQQVIQNAKMGLGLPLMEQLNAKKKAAEMEKKLAEMEKKLAETEKKTGETEKKTDGPMRTF